MTKRQQFIKLISKGLEELGAEKTEEKGFPSVCYKLMTRAGRLNITMPTDEDSKVLTVYTRFQDPEEGHRIATCNPYSGKWNFHYHHRGSDVKVLSRAVLIAMREVAA